MSEAGYFKKIKAKRIEVRLNWFCRLKKLTYDIKNSNRRRKLPGNYF